MSLFNKYTGLVINAGNVLGMAILIAAIAAPLFGQTASADLTIVIRDENGSQIQGAAATLSGRGLLKRTAVTNESGEAVFKNVPAGNFIISVEARGFTSSIHNTNVAGATTVELVLVTGAISETVTVTAERGMTETFDTPAPVSIVQREEIERLAPSSIGDVFRYLPGTSTVNEGAFQVRPRIRGLDSNRVLILVDGERLNNSRTSTSNSGIEMGLVDLSQIDSMEIVRGSGSVLYGTDALAGTINIISRDTPPRREKGFRFGAMFDTFYTSNETGRRGNLAVTGSSKYFAFRVAQSLERFDNYFTGKADGSVPESILNIGGISENGEVLNSQSHAGNTQAVARFFINDSNVLRFAYDRRRASNVGSPTLVGVFNGFFPFSDRDKFSGRYETVAITDYLSRISVSGFYQQQNRNFTNILTVPPMLPFFPGQYQFSETVTDTRTSGIDVQTDWALGSRNFLTAGFSFFRDSNTDRRLLITSTTPTSPNQTTNNSRSVPDADLTNFAFFGQNEFRLNNKLRLIAGLRVDNFNTNSSATEGFSIPATFTPEQIEDLGLTGLVAGLDVKNTAVTGDVGAAYSLSQNITLAARLGRSFRTPNIFERFFTDFGSTTGFVVGNPGLKPESGINIDTSFRYRSKKFSGSATYFNNYFTNFLASVIAVDRNGMPIEIPRNPPLTPIPVYQTQNISKARIQGVELEFEAPIRISFGYLTPNGNFSYLRGNNPETGDPLNFISPFRTNAGVRWENFGKAYFVNYNVRIVAKQDRLTDDFLALNFGPEPGFVTHDISGGYYFRLEKFNFRINAGIANLFDRAYNEQFVYAPARGRSFTLGTTWEIK